MNKKADYSIPEIFVWIFVVVFILLLAFWTNNTDLKQRYNSLQKDYIELNQSYNKLSQDYQELEEENKAIKEDVSKLLIEYYGKELVWDIFGAGKYKRGLCALKIVLRGEVPFVDILPC